MLHIPVTCPSGSHEFAYSISTPTQASTSSIEEGIPTILFIHSGWASQEIFESQFADPELRQFNLVAIDVLGHGSTRGFIGDQRYTPKETSDDLICVMDALNLPPCHIFGLSLGGTVGLEMASTSPERVLSLTICSPVTPTELEDVIAGRMQVYNYWMEIFQRPSGCEDEPRQKELLDETLWGAMQLLYNNDKSCLANAATTCDMVRAIDIWSGTPQKLKQSYDACIRWFTERTAIPPSSLAKIKCPVSIIHCSEDVGYAVENADCLAQTLRDVGVSVSLHHVSGPHYGNLTNSESINPILRDTVLSVSGIDPDTVKLPPAEFEDNKMRTPWTELLLRFGYDPNESDPEEFVFGSWFSLPPVVPEQRTLID